MFYIATISHFP